MKRWMSLAIVLAISSTAAVGAANPFTAAVQQQGHWGAIDGTNKKIIPLMYDKVGLSLEEKKGDSTASVVADAQKNDTLGLIEVQYKDLRGFYDRTGKAIVPVSYDHRSAWTDKTLLVRSHDQYGYYGSDGTVIAEPVYDSASVFCNGLAGVGKAGQHGFIDGQGSLVIPLNYEEVGTFQEDRATVRKNGKWGVIDRQGREIIPCQYDEMQYQYSEGYIGVKQGSLWGFADAAGAISIKPAYKRLLGGFHEGKAAVEGTDGYSFINTTGQAVASSLKEIYTPFQEGLAAVALKDGTKGYIDQSGSLLFKAPYKTISAFDGGLAEYSQSVTSASAGGVVAITLGGHNDHVGSPVIVPAMDRSLGVGIGIDAYPYDDEPYYGQSRGHGLTVGAGLTMYNRVKRGYIDKTGKVIVDSHLDYVLPMSADGTFVKAHDFWGYVRRDGSYLVQPEYNTLESDENLGLFLAENKDDKWGAMSMGNGAVIIPFQYDMLKTRGDVLVYKQQGRYGILDKQGQKISDAIYRDVGTAAEGLIPVRLKDAWYYIHMDGQKAFDAPAGTKEAGAMEAGYAPIKVGGKWGVINSQGQVTAAPVYEKLVVL